VVGVFVQVVEVNNAIVLKQNAYMLFFQRVYTPEQMARQEQQLLQLPQQLSLPQESQQQQQEQSKSQRRRNNKKKNEANNAQQQQQPQPTAAPAVATEEAKAGPPPEWKLPKYRVFYTEEESGEESWIKDLLLVAEVPAEVPTYHTPVTRVCFGGLTVVRWWFA
jgi:hemolysin activation/secretion protein